MIMQYIFWVIFISLHIFTKNALFQFEYASFWPHIRVLFLNMTYNDMYVSKKTNIHCLLICHLDNNVLVVEKKQNKLDFFFET